MNAKQLRQAAEGVASWDWGDVLDSGMLKNSESITAHILATVREDDDELLSQDNWLDTIQHECELVIHYEHCRTRGDFRTLCRLLGVTLKEDA